MPQNVRSGAVKRLGILVTAAPQRAQGRVSLMARVALAIATALLGVGCGSGDARPGQRSAFLGDVSQLEPGKGDEPSLLYIRLPGDAVSWRDVEAFLDSRALRCRRPVPRAESGPGRRSG